MNILTTLILFIVVCIGNVHSQLQGVTSLHVDGNQIKDQDGNTVRIIGMNRQGTDFACIVDSEIFFGPVDQQSVANMKSWGRINAVRVPINEDCWGSWNGANSSVSGQIYQDAIFKFVTLLNSEGLAVIIDLHWTSDTLHLATGQQPMPNKLHSPIVWENVTNLFKDNTLVIFDIFNEPAPDNNAWDSTAGWECWLNGGWCNGISFETVGSQDLVNLIRGLGSQNIIMVGGIQYSTSLASWLQYKPSDPLNNIAASLHAYDFNYCHNKGCWDNYLVPVAAQFPIIVGEVGEIDCGTDFLNDFLPYAQQHGLHVIAFSWYVGGCTAPSLITDYSGTPTNEGVGFKNYLEEIDNGITPQSPITFPVYTDSFSHWVEDWSSGIYNETETGVVHTGKFSFSFWPNSTASTFFVWCWDCINTRQHKGIEFYFDGGAGPFMDMQISLLKYDFTAKTTSEVGNPVPLTQVVGSVPNSWNFGYVALEDFNYETEGLYDGFWVKATNPTNVEVFFDDIYVLAISDANDSKILNYNIFLLCAIVLLLIMLL